MAAAPLPEDWLRAYARVQRVSDRELLVVMRASVRDVNRTILDLNRRLDSLRGTFSDAIRREQMLILKSALLREQERIFRSLNDIVSLRRVQAAERAIRLGGLMDSVLFTAAGRPELATALTQSLTQGLRSTVEVVTARMVQSAVPLAERVYRTKVWMDGRIQTKINSALARGLTAREFAAEACDWISPNTPGGVRYASMRLARTEINNAYHAVAVNNAADKPWVTAMKWNLSRSHPKADQCDDYANSDKFGLGAGLFPPKEVPSKPHPQCFCYMSPEVVDEDEFIEGLVTGQYDGYLASKIPQYRGADAPLLERVPVQPRRAVKAVPSSAAGRLQDRAKIHALNLANDSPAGKVQMGKILAKQAALVPNSMLRLQRARVLNAEQTREMRRINKSPGMTGGYSPAIRSIEFADDVLDASFANTARYQYQTNWWVKIDADADPLASVASHEVGHHVHEMIKRLDERRQALFWSEASTALGVPRKFDTLRDVNAQADDWVVANKKAMGLKVSKYGAGDSHELLAEIWTEYTESRAARPHIRAVGDLMLRYAERGAL